MGETRACVCDAQSDQMDVCLFCTDNVVSSRGATMVLSGHSGVFNEKV